VVPDRNQKDLDEIPKVLRRKLNWVLAKSMSDVLSVALMERPKSTGKSSPRERGKGIQPRQPLVAKPLRKSQRERSLPIRP
jgi:hypothetical protein